MESDFRAPGNSKDRSIMYKSGFLRVFAYIGIDRQSTEFDMLNDVEYYRNTTQGRIGAFLGAATGLALLLTGAGAITGGAYLLTRPASNEVQQTSKNQGYMKIGSTNGQETIFRNSEARSVNR